MQKRKTRLKTKRQYIKKIKSKINTPPHKIKKKTLSIIEKITEPVILNPSEVIPKRRRKKRGTGTNSPDKMYFTKDTEDAIIEYNNTIDETIRNNIYNARIKYPFEKLVENIFNTFKFTYFETSPLDVQKETVTHLVSNINKFDVIKGKAFAYFSIIAKHYLIALNNGVWNRRNKHVEIGEEHDENTVQLQTEDKHYKNAEVREFMNLMIGFWENNVNKIFTKQRDLEIANAVIELFRNSDRIDSFNKKALYLYIRDISSCKTQQITKIINKMKLYQTNIAKSYRNNGIINTENYIKS